jgi:hypothetical protein
VRALAGWLMILGAVVAGLVSLLGAVSGLLTLPKVMDSQDVSYAVGSVVGQVVVVVLMFVLARKLLRAGRTRLSKTSDTSARDAT